MLRDWRMEVQPPCVLLGQAVQGSVGQVWCWGLLCPTASSPCRMPLRCLPRPTDCGEDHRDHPPQPQCSAQPGLGGLRGWELRDCTSCHEGQKRAMGNPSALKSSILGKCSHWLSWVLCTCVISIGRKIKDLGLTSEQSHAII